MESIEVLYTGPGKNSQDLSTKDNKLVVSNIINSTFGQADDYIELFIYGENGNLLGEDYDAADYYPSILNNPKNNTYSSLTLDPETDLKNRGFSRGNLNVQYNFYKRLFNSAYQRYYWIKQISPSRTEIKLASQVLSDSDILRGYEQYRVLASSVNYYPVFYLNFGGNEIEMASNVLYGEDDQGAYILVKLYEPLPSQYGLKTELWIVDKIAESVSYDVNISVEAETVVNLNALKGPNFNVNVNTKNGQTTPYYNYDNLLKSPVTSSAQKLASYYQDRAIQINVDYSNFENFIHFSSATERVSNFVYKLQLIESSSAIIDQQIALSGGGSAATSSITAEQLAIDNIIKNFDIYEYFLYFESSSWAWPKSNSVQPYTLYSVSSSEAQSFLGSETTVPTAGTASLLFSASYYDATNKDLLHNSVPQYLLDDPSNQPYVTFLDMIGQHFDNIWIYYKDLSNRFNATNNPNTGISLDLVSDALRGLGMQLYTNTNVSDNLYYTLFGINADGSLLPPTGSEIITNYVTSSLTTLPAETIQDELYKRVYHNLPYLLKSKGTARGIKALISIYGIPEDILTIREFGGNYTGSLDGVIDLNASEYKVNISTGSNGNVTGSLTISSSLLSPYTTIQYYQGDTRLNDTNLEIGFSPADVINSNITSSLGTFDINQLIGSPSYQYSSSYGPLVSASNAYFSSYTQPNSIWEYIRLLKFYNNTLFKTIKDFVPARANVSTGIIIKSHMLERNKYARHEPQFTFNDYSQSIDMGSISGSDGGALSGSTYWDGFLVTPLGLASYTSSNGIEKFTGELNGSEIVATDGLALQQGDYISHVTGAVEVYNYGALYQNVTSSVRSTQLFDLDYTSDQTKPVNYNAITYSISQSQVNNYATYTNPNNPFAQVQDYNYNLVRSTTPRYSGSFVESAAYTTYTDGDQSYGKTAAIDKIKYQYAYIVDIYSSSFQLPYRAKGQIKYIIDNDQNVINLSKTNTNWFSVQNIFKAGESADVSLFDYDPTNPYVQRLNNDDNDFTIWESGYSYTPILYNIGGSGSINFNYTIPSSSTSTSTIPGYTTISPGTVGYWSLSGVTWVPGTNPPPSYVPAILGFTASVNTTAVSQSNISIRVTNTSRSNETYDFSIQIAKGTTSPYKPTTTLSPSAYPTWLSTDSYTISVLNQQLYNPNSGTTTVTSYITSITDNSPCWYAPDSMSIILSATQSLNYGNITQIGSSSAMDQVVFPLSISPNDIIKLYNASSSWDPKSEYRVLSINTFDSGSLTYYRMFLDRDLNLADVSGSAIPNPICKYIVLKRLKDETSVIFNYDLPQPIHQDGTLFPQYIGDGIKEASGNTIKALKQQNLI